MDKPLFKEAMLSLITVFILNKIGLAYGFYVPTLEYDSLVHFVAGVCVSLGALWFYFHFGFFNPAGRKYLNFFFISLTGIIFIAFVWESFELVIGVMSVAMPGYFYDTALDVSFGILGAILASIYAYNKELKCPKSLSTAESAQPQELISA